MLLVDFFWWFVLQIKLLWATDVLACAKFVVVECDSAGCVGKERFQLNFIGFCGLNCPFFLETLRVAQRVTTAQHAKGLYDRAFITANACALRYFHCPGLSFHNRFDPKPAQETQEAIRLITGLLLLVLGWR